MVATILGLVAASVLGAIAAIATRVQLLPDVIDVSIILTGSGLGSLLGAVYGAFRSLGGSLFFGGLTALVFLIILLVELVS